MRRLLLLIIFTTMLIACKDAKEEKDPNIFYTCSMDPQVLEKKPGKCPICKMELTKTIITPNKRDNSLRLSDTQIKLANIKMQEVKGSSIAGNTLFRGTVVPNEKKIDIISSRVAGRIEKLYFKNKGEEIHIGDKLYEIYSEELQVAVRQYLMMKEKALTIRDNSVNYNQMLKSAKDKLSIWGLSEKQINSLNTAEQLIPFYSNRIGVITEIALSEGGYINEGEAIVTISDYSSVWVEAEVYPEDMKIAFPGGKVKIIVEAFPNEKIEGTISFEEPELKSQTGFSIVRIEVPNVEKKIKPGMRATVALSPDLAFGIFVPDKAILYEKGLTFVWISNKRNKGEFIRRQVNIGNETNGLVEIKSGVKEGEQVVVSGAYLLNSEYLLRNNFSITTSVKEEDIKETVHIH